MKSHGFKIVEVKCLSGIVRGLKQGRDPCESKVTMSFQSHHFATFEINRKFADGLGQMLTCRSVILLKSVRLQTILLLECPLPSMRGSKRGPRRCTTKVGIVHRRDLRS